MKELRKTLPLGANSDPSTAVARKMDMFGVLASVYHAKPYRIQWVVAQSVSFWKLRTTTRSCDCLEISQSYDGLFTTVAVTFPVSQRTSSILKQRLNRDQFTKSHTANIFDAGRQRGISICSHIRSILSGVVRAVDRVKIGYQLA